MMAMVSRCVRGSLLLFSRRTGRGFVTKKVDQDTALRVRKNLSTADSDVYMCCDINLVSTLTKNDVKGFPEYLNRIIEANPGKL